MCRKRRRFRSSGCRDRLWGTASAQGATGSVGARLNGFFSGAQLGYNWQFGERYVAGLEADSQGAGVRGGDGFQTLTPAAVYPPFVAATAYLNRSLEYLGTVRGRLGYAATPTMLLYATGGLAYGGVSSSAVVRQSLTPSILGSAAADERLFPKPRRLDRRRRRRIGADRTAFRETRISLLRSRLLQPKQRPLAHQAIAGPGEVTTLVSNATRFDGFLVRAGLNYRFAGSAPAGGRPCAAVVSAAGRVSRPRRPSATGA